MSARPESLNTLARHLRTRKPAPTCVVQLRDGLVREVVKRAECTWCGCPARFRYGHADDWRGIKWFTGNFCGIDDMRAYHDLRA